MENGVRKREWVKTAAIILLAVLLDARSAGKK